MVKNTYHDKETPTLLLSPIAAHEAQQDQDCSDGNTEEAHVHKLHGVASKRAKDLQEGAAIHAHPDAHS